MIPPLPSEQHGSTIGARHLWLILVPHKALRPSYVRDMFISLYGREPDRLYSPEESKTEFWWLGWITREESQQWVRQNEKEQS